MRASLMAILAFSFLSVESFAAESIFKGVCGAILDKIGHSKPLEDIPFLYPENSTLDFFTSIERAGQNSQEFYEISRVILKLYREMGEELVCLSGGCIPMSFKLGRILYKKYGLDSFRIETDHSKGDSYYHFYLVIPVGPMLDENAIIIDPTWQQFSVRKVQFPLFIGTLADLKLTIEADSVGVLRGEFSIDRFVEENWAFQDLSKSRRVKISDLLRVGASNYYQYSRAE